MGNSLLDIIVFGRNAGKNASAKAKETEVADLTLAHVDNFENEIKDAGIETSTVSPKLLPDYTRKVNENDREGRYKWNTGRKQRKRKPNGRR